jgi:hypothetical protein
MAAVPIVRVINRTAVVFGVTNVPEFERRRGLILESEDRALPTRQVGNPKKGNSCWPPIWRLCREEDAINQQHNQKACYHKKQKSRAHWQTADASCPAPLTTS